MEPMPQIADKKEFMAELQNRIEKKCRELNMETIHNYPAVAHLLVKEP